MTAKPVVVFSALGALCIGVGLLAAAGGTQAPRTSGGEPEANAHDVEALARMLASENPNGSLLLWVEQCWTQIHSLKRGQSLFSRITAGRGYGPQNKYRPVATTEPARPIHRAVARLVLLGSKAATWANARKFFEPAQQDAMFMLAESARAKRARGEPLTARETRALGYEKDAAAVRREWSSDGSRPLGQIDGVEFWT